MWDADHPAPKANDAGFERTLLKWFADDAAKQLETMAASPEKLRRHLGDAVATVIGRTFSSAGDVEWKQADKQDRGDYVEITGLLRNTTFGEELPVVWLYPQSWNRKAIVWLDDAGKSSIYNADGSLNPAVLQLVKGGAAVVSADLLFQGEFLKDGKPVEKTPSVSNPRESAAYTLGYNDSLFAQRTHDVLTIVKFLRSAKLESHPSPSSVGVAGFGAAGPIVLAARAVAGDAIDFAAVDTGGFRFGKLLDYRDPQFLPGGAKYFDLPGLIALGAPHRLWLTGEASAPAVVGTDQNAGPPKELTIFHGEKSAEQAAAAKWLLE